MIGLLSREVGVQVKLNKKECLIHAFFTRRLKDLFDPAQSRLKFLQNQALIAYLSI
jgi:hypothetical protein